MEMHLGDSYYENEDKKEKRIMIRLGLTFGLLTPK